MNELRLGLDIYTTQRRRGGDAEKLRIYYKNKFLMLLRNNSILDNTKNLQKMRPVKFFKL
jgi:hypothetical protein